MSPPFLAADLDGEVVVLDVSRALLIQVDAWSRRVWEACAGRTADEVAAALDAPLPRVAGTLEDLAGIGLVSRDRERWQSAALRWV